MKRLETPQDRCLETCFVGRTLDGMCIGLVVTNPAGRVRWMNRAAERVLGVKKDEAHGELLSHVLKDPNLAAFWHESLDIEDTVMGEITVNWPRSAELKANATSCMDVGGDAVGRALLFCDVTAEKVLQVKLSEAATRKLLDMAERGGDDSAPVAGLTPQELRVLRLVGSGLGNTEIAEQMHVAPSTVRSHLKNIYRKTGLTSRPEAVRYALQHGLT